MGHAERLSIVAYALGLVAYNACAKVAGFSFWAWLALRDLPGFNETATEVWLASYYVFLAVLTFLVAALLIRDVPRRDDMTLNRQMLWLLACGSFLPIVPVYVELHAWWKRDEGPPIRLLFERLKWNFANTPLVSSSRRILMKSSRGRTAR